MIICVGKTYTTRDKSALVTIVADTGHKGTYRMRGEDHLGRITWRSAKGRFAAAPHGLDLINQEDRI